MKKLFSDLFLPTAITAILLILMSASFKADDLITLSRAEFISVMSQEQNEVQITLIIYPLHGGADGCAVSISGDNESLINLQISQKTELIAAFFGIKTVTTRDSEDIEYGESTISIHDKKVYDSNRRVDLINNTNNAVLISIHQNFYNDSNVTGAQVFYGNLNDSIGLAENITSNFKLFAAKVRIPCQISETIYIFKKINCPAVLIECGFISNYDENSLLTDKNYQNKIALAIISGYLQYENRLNYTVGGTYES